MKTWFITGSSSGIGKGIAKAVLAKGDNAVVMARDKKKLDDLVQAYPEQTLALSLELTDKKSIQNAVKTAEARFGVIDVLVNNAGHGYRAAIEEGENKSIEELYGTNVFGPVELFRLILPQMRKRRSGAIINLSSIAAVSSGVGSGYYASTKAALELLSDALYQEVSPLGIKVMVVEPGAFRTNFYGEGLRGTESRISDYDVLADRYRKENLVNNRDQPGDPMKGGEVIVDTILSGKIPSRLLLGSDAVQTAQDVLRDRLRETEEWKDVSSRTDY